MGAPSLSRRTLARQGGDFDPLCDSSHCCLRACFRMLQGKRNPSKGDTQVNHTCTRRTFLHTSMMAAAVLAAERHLVAATEPAKPAFPVADYHVHLSPDLSIEQAVDVLLEVGVGLDLIVWAGMLYDADLHLPLFAQIDGLFDGQVGA